MASHIDLDVAGHRVTLAVPPSQIENVHLPLLTQLNEKAEKQPGRFVVLLAGPPGAGKSTLAALWQHLAKQRNIGRTLQPLPMDGFHFSRGELNERTITIDGQPHPLSQFKGSPESFNLPALAEALGAARAGRPLRWPRYDRQIHDPLPHAIDVLEDGILLVEGNYLLLDQPGWRELRADADFGMFVQCAESISRPDLIARHQQGGRSARDAAEFYDRNDHRNYQLVVQHRLDADVVLRVAPDRGLTWRAERR